MKVVNVFLKSLFAVFVTAMFTGCDEESEPIPYYPMSEVTRCERDSISMSMLYGRDGLSEYSLFIHDTFSGTSSVKYSAGKISCYIKGIRYDIQLSNTRGARRVESVSASEGRNTLSKVEYRFDEQNRLSLARIDIVYDTPVYVSYKYEGNNVIIHDGSDNKNYTLEFSDEDNKGYVCNVLDFAGSPLTSQYVIHPDLYFLNIFGAPFSKLPVDQEVEYTTDSRNSPALARVGKYTYTY